MELAQRSRVFPGKLVVAHLVKIALPFMGSEFSLPYSQATTIGTHP